MRGGKLKEIGMGYKCNFEGRNNRSFIILVEKPVGK
jgi:hypothetical protein